MCFYLDSLLPTTRERLDINTRTYIILGRIIYSYLLVTTLVSKNIWCALRIANCDLGKTVSIGIFLSTWSVANVQDCLLNCNFDRSYGPA